MVLFLCGFVMINFATVSGDISEEDVCILLLSGYLYLSLFFQI